MDNERIGKFILELRKEANITQKELAQQLNITDKAVSKWERGLGCPDISLLMDISSFFKIDVSELLNGKKGSFKKEEGIKYILQYADEKIEKKAETIKNMTTIVFTMFMMLFILIGTILNIAISNAFTWSLFSNISITFIWLILLPIIQYRKNGIIKSMILLSILIIPFLYLLDLIIYNSELLLSISIPISIMVIILIWGIYILFKKLKSKKILFSLIILLLLIPVNFIMNIILYEVINIFILDVWTKITLTITTIGLCILLLIYFKKKK